MSKTAIAISWLCYLSLLTGCFTNAGLKSAAELRPGIVIGEGFKHRTFLQAGGGNTLHVYIEGDGQAWLNRKTMSRDPTPKNPLMLSLMSQDDAVSVYIGRPCYFSRIYNSQMLDPGCNPYWWTFGRYSEEVVHSMAQAVEHLAQNYSGIVLIGHSGGGTLATLVAQRCDKVTGLVTVAANLNLAAWVAFHHYTPLYGSLDPTLVVSLPEKIQQLHFIGNKDKKIHAQWSDIFMRQHPSTSMTVLDDVSHQHGWESHWPGILQQLKTGP